MATREAEKSREKSIYPFARKCGGQSKGKKSSDRISPHGGNVTQPTSQASMPDALRRLPIPPEVNAFQAEVSRDQRFMPRRNAQNGTVISRSQCHFGILRLLRKSKSVEELAFGNQSRNPAIGSRL